MSEPKHKVRDNIPRPPAVYRAMAAVLGPLEHLTGLDCRRFTRLASDRMDRALTLWERVVYRLHRLVCAVCRAHDNRNRCLHELFKQAGSDAKLCDDAQLDAEAKEKLRRRLHEETPS